MPSEIFPDCLTELFESHHGLLVPVAACAGVKHRLEVGLRVSVFTDMLIDLFGARQRHAKSETDFRIEQVHGL